MTENETSRPAGDGTAQGAWSYTQHQSSADHHPLQDSFDRFDAIPHELRAWRQWCVWQSEKVKGQAKLTKVPYNPHTRKHASSTDARTWSTFDECVAAVRAGQWSGIGFVLSPDDPYCFIDLDQPKDEHGNRVDRPDVVERQVEYEAGLNSYSEVSPGGGLHVIVRAKLDGKGRKRDFTEIYDRDRYMTMTGNIYRNMPIEPRQEAVSYIHSSLVGSSATTDAADVDMTTLATEDDPTIFNRASQAANGDKFTRTWNCDLTDYGNDHSRADAALCEMLAFYTSSAEQIERMWMQSPLGQRPHKTLIRPKYRRDTIRKGLVRVEARRAPIPESVATSVTAFGQKFAAEAAERRFASGPSTPSTLSGSSPVPTQAPSFPPLIAQPFAFRHPREIPLRDWLYGRVILRGAVTATVGHGGSGKSALTIVEALAMVTGKPLLGVLPWGCSALGIQNARDGYRVWAINLEEPKEELERRISAAMLHHKLEPKDCGDRLFVNGNDTQLCIAEETRNGTTICAPDVEAVKANIRRNGIDVVIVDPFVSSHRVNENDNGAVDLVVKQWGKIAGELGVAIHLVHHLRKTNGAQATDEDMRGAVAMLSGVRKNRVLNTMSEDQAEKADVPIEDRFDYFFIKLDGKSNMTRRSGGHEWYKFDSYVLPNGVDELPGDDVGVVTRWQWPNTRIDLAVEQLEAVRVALADGQAREDVRAAHYVGKVVAVALGIDLSAAKPLIARWLKDGALTTVWDQDDKRKSRLFVRIDDWTKAVCSS